MWIDLTPRLAGFSVRSRSFRGGSAAVIAALAIVALPIARSSELPLRQVGADIPLPGKANRFDYATVDPQHRLLFLAHLLIDAPARLAFVACDANAKLLLVDMTDMHVLSVHEVGRDPDVLAFDPGLHRLYVASESGVVAVFELDAKELRLLGLKFLAHEAHSVAVDPATHLVYFPLQNIQGRGVLRVMSPTEVSQATAP